MALVELTGALTLLAVGFLALAIGLSGGFRQVALARQRQSAAEVGSGRIEHIRNVPYEYVAVSSDVTHNTDPGHPDHFVADATNSFDYSGAGTWEPLIEDASAGQVVHFESPVQVGTTTLEVFQYVTWVDDPGISGTQDYRRVTVVVRYLSPASGGVSKMVRTSSFFTPGSVTLGGTAPGAALGTSGPTVTPTPSPTGTGCAGDNTAPAGTFEPQAGSGSGSESGYTGSTSITLSFPTVADPCTPIRLRFSNGGSVYGSDINHDPANPSIGWTLSTGDGVKSIYAKIRDGVGNEKTVGPKTITLDTTRPTVPGTLSRTVSCSGNSRTVNLTWGSSTDTNFRGYRIYKRVNGAAWLELATVSSTFRADTDSKAYDSLQYYVVGYDKAGNESTPTNTVSLAKNQCA